MDKDVEDFLVDAMRACNAFMMVVILFALFMYGVTQ